MQLTIDALFVVAGMWSILAMFVPRMRVSWGRKTRVPVGSTTHAGFATGFILGGICSIFGIHAHDYAAISIIVLLGFLLIAVGLLRDHRADGYNY